MTFEQILKVLEYVKSDVLNHESKFTTHAHFRDSQRKRLIPDATSVPFAEQRCISGAVIEALAALEICRNPSQNSPEYKMVMYNLGDSLGDFDRGQEKIEAVMRINNKEGYPGVVKMIDKAIGTIKQHFQNKAQR